MEAKAEEVTLQARRSEGFFFSPGGPRAEAAGLLLCSFKMQRAPASKVSLPSAGNKEKLTPEDVATDV